MQNLQNKLINILKDDSTYFSNGKLLKNKLTEDALKLESKLIKYILSDDKLKKHFFIEVNDVLVFKKDKFIQFINDKQFLPESYTSFKNIIGLLDENGDYFREKNDVVLAWPYKDCLLEGGQDAEEQKRNEIFYNEILAPDEIDRLFDPKVLTNFKHYDKDGEYPNPKGISKIDNLIIKGNNLLALHSLKKLYRRKVKLVYIDPPYNIGGDGFNYNDKFNHSTWLTFMKNRLIVVKELLKNDGAIFVQIDHHEVAYLTVLLDEIFGVENKAQIISVKVASPSGFKAVNPGPIDVAEYILFYTINKPSFEFKLNYVPAEYHENYNLYVDKGNGDLNNWKFSPIKDKVLEFKGFKNEKEAKEIYGEQFKTVIRGMIADFAFKDSNNVASIRDLHKPTETIRKKQLISRENNGQVVMYEKQDGSLMYLYKGGEVTFYSRKIKELDGKRQVIEILSNFWDHISWAGIAKEGGVKLKNGKKPEKLIKQILDMATNEGDIVVDFF